MDRRTSEETERSAFQPIDAKVIAHAKLARPWINPLSLLVLRDALKAEQEEVILEGKKYTITYEENNKVWLQVIGASAPCGRFDTGELLTPGRIFDGL